MKENIFEQALVLVLCPVVVIGIIYGICRIWFLVGYDAVTKP